MNYDFSRIKLLHLSEANKLVIILRNREFDRYTREFLTRHPNAVAIHIGCGLDSLFERVDNGQVEWYDLDLPNVIELRRDLFGGEKERYHLLACPVLDEVWLDVVRAHRGRPFLFVAEGVSIAIGEFGMIRNSKAGRTASVCLMSGDSSTRLSGGWTPFVGWSPSFTCSSQCASSTSSLERRDNS